MSKTALKEWLSLSDEAKKVIFDRTGNTLSLSNDIVEKDWWVVQTLALIFQMDCASSLIFKGGTSLSKGWKLIQRFSEDIDPANIRFIPPVELLAKWEADYETMRNSMLYGEILTFQEIIERLTSLQSRINSIIH